MCKKLSADIRGENLGVGRETNAEWYEGQGLYPLQAMIQPIGLRFKYHFHGSRNTNRVDKVRMPFFSRPGLTAA